MIIITGATGKLGRHVINGLLERVPAQRIVAIARDPASNSAAALAGLGVEVRQADYDEPDTLERAFQGASKVLLISGSELGKRAEQHRNVIAAAARVGTGLLVYTSLLRAYTSSITLAREHQITEANILDSGLNYVILRNGWYTENYTENLAGALESGAIIGSAGDGKIAAATREDFAAAAVEALTGAGHTNKTYELAGDDAFTMAEYAAAVSHHSGKSVTYNDMPTDAFYEALASYGLPAPLAAMLVSADVAIRAGELDDHSTDLTRLIGRPTTPLDVVLARALK